MTAARPPLPPPPSQWPAHMDAAQVAFVTGCSERQVRKAGQMGGALGAACAFGAYGRKLWSKDQVMAWRGIQDEPVDPFVNATAA